jgi:hypothetical protein
LLEGNAKTSRKLPLAHADHGTVQPNAVPNETVNISGFPARWFSQGVEKVLLGPRDIRHGIPFRETPPRRAAWMKDYLSSLCEYPCVPGVISADAGRQIAQRAAQKGANRR